jgi:hypothetical protein
MSTEHIPDIETSSIPKLEEILSPDSSESKEPFIVDTPSSAIWAARKIIDAESRIEKYTEQSKQYKTRFDSWFTKPTTPMP